MEPKIYSLIVTIALLYCTRIVLAQDNGRTLDSPETQVTFHLFTKKNPEVDYPLTIGDDDNLASSPFSSKRQTKLIIHGWTGRASDTWVVDMRKNYLTVGDYNVIAVNWYPLSTSLYPTAATLTRPVGVYVGDFLNYLNTQTGTSYRNVHILGHSLGAHIGGFAGSRTTKKIGRITGMDAARPLYEWPELKEPKDRLDNGDALFVDIIHTCSGTAGFTRPIGHIDFYPNGGSFNQPGCPLGVTESQICSHARSHDFMADSIIYPNEFVARKCEDWSTYKKGDCADGTKAIMGENVSHDSRGIFYLRTKSASPYGENEKKN